MAIEFIRAQKRQRYLILILTLIICAILLVVWLGFFRTPAPAIPVSSPTVAQPKIEINWNVLKDAGLEELKSFNQIPALKNKVGRENPFATY